MMMRDHRVNPSIEISQNVLAIIVCPDIDERVSRLTRPVVVGEATDMARLLVRLGIDTVELRLISNPHPYIRLLCGEGTEVSVHSPADEHHNHQITSGLLALLAVSMYFPFRPFSFRMSPSAIILPSSRAAADASFRP